MTTHSYRHSIPADILALSHERDLLRRRGQYDRADLLKRQLEEAGYAVKDNPRGAHLVILPSILADGKLYHTVRQLPSLLHEAATCTFSVNLLAQNTIDQTRRCIESVLHYAGNTSLEIILVDNASQDGLDFWADDLKRLDPRVQVLRATRIMGIAEARNVGFKRSRGQFILQLDTSYELSGDIFTPLAQTFQDPTIGLSGYRGFLTEDLRHFSESEQEEVEAIDGTCLAFRRALLNKAELLDEGYRYPHYMDIDFSFTLRDTGMRAVLTPSLPITQHSNAVTVSLSLSDAERARLEKRNFYRYLSKWGDREDLLLDSEDEDEEIEDQDYM